MEHLGTHIHSYTYLFGHQCDDNALHINIEEWVNKRQHNVTNHTSSQTGFMNMTSEFNVLQSLSQSPTSIEHVWNVVEWETHSMKAHRKNLQEMHDAIKSTRANVSKVSHGIHAMNSWHWFQSQGRPYPVPSTFETIYACFKMIKLEITST